MIIDLRDYRYLKAIVELKVSLKQDKSTLDLVRDIAIPSNIPLVVVAHYMAKVKGEMTDELKTYIQDLVDFYHYTDILGYEEI